MGLKDAAGKPKPSLCHRWGRASVRPETTNPAQDSRGGRPLTTGAGSTIPTISNSPMNLQSREHQPDCPDRESDGEPDGMEAPRILGSVFSKRPQSLAPGETGSLSPRHRSSTRTDSECLSPISPHARSDPCRLERTAGEGHAARCPASTLHGGCEPEPGSWGVRTRGWLHRWAA